LEAELRDRLQTSLGGAYTLEQELSGGMARVFVAEETNLGRKVVVKVLPPELAAEVSVERFRREIQFAAQLQHPLIVPVLSATQQGALLYYTMPFVTGESLRARLRRDGALPLGDALRIWRDLVTALAFAHGRGVIHRDIKPENILLTESGHDGGGEYAMVTDFGVARAIDTAVTSGGLTATGISVGTPAYMAPEQVAADAHVDQHADIYSAGVVAYEMLTGQPLFAEVSPQRMLAAHLTREPEPISKLRPTIPGDVNSLVMRCLAKDPASRLTSAELRREIEGLLAKGTASSFESGQPAARTNADVDPGVSTAPRAAARSRWRRFAVVAAAAVVAGGALVPLVSRDRQRVPATPTIRTARLGPRSVAVLPFENSSSDKDNEYFADGVTDELISALARVRGLRVTSRSTSYAFKGSHLGARTIGDSLGVQLVLEGSVRKEGNQLRIFTQLTRAADDSAVWSQTYDRELRDVFRVQEELAQSILVELQKAMGNRPVASVASGGADSTAPVQLVRHTTKDRDAYDLYLRGRYFWNRRTREGFTKAASFFNEAIARDSTFAAAWAGLADSYCILANFGLQPAREVCPRTADAARRAIGLDSTLAEAHASLGFVNLFYDWDFDTAERELKQAIALDSTYTNAYLWLNHLAWARGDTSGSLAFMRRAVEVEPLSLILRSRLGTALWRAGRLKEAEEQLRHTLDLDSTFVDARGTLTRVELDEGRFDAAVADAGRVGRHFDLAYVYARAGRREDALRAVRELEATSRRGEWVYPIHMAYLYAALGNADAAFAWLDRSYAARDPDLIFIAAEPFLAPLRSDPRLVALARKVGVVR
jgi:serine/threonine-protein kinase